MAAFNFITVRLGKDSIPDIKQICASDVGILSKTFTICVKCTQVPDNYGHGDYVFLWLGSDNNKGMPTNWKQGFKAVGRVTKVLRGKNYNDTSETTIEIVYIFKESVNRMDILRCAPTAYYWCSSMPLIGLDDHANQTIRNMTSTTFADLRAFFSAIDAVTNNFKNHILQIEPGFEQYFDCSLPNPQLFPNAKNLTEIDSEKQISKPISSLQQIFYGAPGTGKSNIIKEQTKGEDVIRTTFHPDTDYSTFVGTYKPTTEFAPVFAIIGDKAVETGREEKRISYEFVSQAFLQAYVAAWKKVAEAKEGALKKQFLVIEEINRGNCAQIFGDLFQLLDRNDYGYSDYPIQADADMQKQLKRLFEGVEIENAESINALYDDRDIVKEVLSGEVLLLPNNLYIWATMNTSDQSLFPIDSAFKRRWDWQYMPISEGRDKNGQSKNWKIEADTQLYSWWSFIQKINDEIYDKTNSEDKKLGYYFCKPINGVIRVETFVSKVLFYLWNDVFKDFDNESGIFAEPYDKFYGTGTRGEVLIAKDKVQTLLDNLHVEVAEIIGADENESASDESGNATTTGSSARDKSVYSINGEGNYVKKTVPLATVTAYVKNYPDVTASELVETWYALGTMIRQIVISKESYEQKLSKTSDAIFAKRYDSLNLPNGEVVYVYNQFTPERINDFISKVNEQSWDIHIEKVAE